MVSESGDGGESDGGKGRPNEGKQSSNAHEHEHDASISLEITRRTDGDGLFWARDCQNPTLDRPALLHTPDQPPRPSFVQFVFCVRPDSPSLYLESSVALCYRLCLHKHTGWCRIKGPWEHQTRTRMNPRLDTAHTTGLQVAPRLTRRILAEAKHPAP